jgi:hypothetical protein
MSAITRVASTSDLPFLGEIDRHVSPDDLANLVSAGRVMVVEVDGVVVGCLRWGLLGPGSLHEPALDPPRLAWPRGRDDLG